MDVIAKPTPVATTHDIWLTEDLRLLRAARDGRLVQNPSGRWIIKGDDRRPDPRRRKALECRGRIAWTVGGVYRLTRKGEDMLEAHS